MTVQKKDAHRLTFNEFEIPTYDDWYQVAMESLKGADFEQKLLTETYEKITLKPIYMQDDIQHIPYLNSILDNTPILRGTEALGYLSPAWKVAQELSCSLPEEANRRARHALAHGLTMMNLRLDGPTRLGVDPEQWASDDVGKRGISIFHMGDFETLLTGIDLEAWPLYISTGPLNWPIFSLLAAACQRQGKDFRKLTGCIGADPLGHLVREGHLQCSLEQAYDSMALFMNWTINRSPEIKTVLIESHPYHDSGCNAVQELAFALATGVDYLRNLHDRGLSISQAAEQMTFSFSVGSHFFMELAKLRAAKILWSRIVELLGSRKSGQKMTIHARTTAWNKTIYDPHVNILRATTEALAAVIAGVDSLHISPFNEVRGKQDALSERIARNTHYILAKEAHLDKIVDPAGGSWFIENLTEQVASHAWQLFQEIETLGGMAAALVQGFPQTQVALVSAKRKENIAKRQDKLVGTNIYVNLQEEVAAEVVSEPHSIYRLRNEHQLKHRQAWKKYSSKRSQHAAKLKNHIEYSSIEFVDLAIKMALEGATLGDFYQLLQSKEAAKPTVKKVETYRAGQPYETLRAAAQAYKSKHGFLPKVFIINLGNSVQDKARAEFSTRFLEVGGFEVIASDGFDSMDDALKATIQSRATIVTICGTDKRYQQLLPSLARKLKQANSKLTILVAGKVPPRLSEECKKSGVDRFIHVHSNCSETLRYLQEMKGIVL